MSGGRGRLIAGEHFQASPIPAPVSEAWIYAADQGEATEGARILTELGFSTRRVNVDGTLRPSDQDGGAQRRPTLMLVLANGADGPAIDELFQRLEDDGELSGVPRVIALATDDLRLGARLAEGHELIVAPYSRVELEVRVARARRMPGAEVDVLRVGALELNLANYQVSIDGRPINFTYMEYELLKFLATHPGRVFTREALLSQVWGYDYYGGERTVDVHIRRLRAKLGQDCGGRIQTVRSVGYRFDG